MDDRSRSLRSSSGASLRASVSSRTSLLKNDPSTSLRNSSILDRLDDGALQALSDDEEHNGSDIKLIISEIRRISSSSKLYGREKEKRNLESIWRKCCQLSRQELCIIRGEPGCGKSRLASSLRPLVHRDPKLPKRYAKAFFLSGKFSPPCYHTKIPFEVFSTALSSYVDQLLDSKNTELIAQCREKLLQEVRNGRDLLVAMVPAFGRLFDQSDLPKGREKTFTGSTQARMFGIEATNRLWDAFSNAISAICFYTPIVLHLDDIQWCGPSSLNLLRSLFVGSKNFPLMVIATSRSDSSEQSDVRQRSAILQPTTAMTGYTSQEFSKLLSDVENHHSVGVSQIYLLDLTLEDVKGLVADILRMRPHQVTDLARVVHEASKGNAFHMYQFLRLVAESNCIKRYSNYWIWDIAQVESTIKDESNSVSGMVVRTIQAMPRPVQEALKIACCMGSDVDISAVDQVLQTPSAPLLQYAADEGFLTFLPQYGGYRFAHDLIRQASFQLISEDDHDEFYLNIGRRLWRGCSPSALEENIMFVVAFMNVGAACVTEERERYKVAELNLRAGIKAFALPSLPDAISFLKKGREFLGVDAWAKRYNLCLDLYSYSAQVEAANGNSEIVEMCYREVDMNAVTLWDKLGVYRAKLKSMEQQGIAKQAVLFCTRVLRQLGLSIPTRASKVAVLRELLIVKWAIRGRTDHGILSLPLMTDSRKRACMDFLAAGSISCMRADPRMGMIYGCRAVLLSLKHGLNASSAFGFCMYAGVLNAFKKVKDAYRFGRLSIQIAEAANSPQSIVRVYLALGYGVLHSMKPIADSLEALENAKRVGWDSGLVESSIYAYMVCDMVQFCSGTKLSALEDSINKTMELRSYYRHPSSQSLFMLQMVKCCQGMEPDPTRLSGTFISFDDVESEQLVAQNKMLLLLMYGLALELAYLHGDFQHAERMAALCRETDERTRRSYFASLLPVLYVLCSIERYRQGFSRKENLKLVRKYRKLVARSAKDAPSNFSHHLFLVDAEIMSINAKHREDDTSALYMAAFYSAEEQDNIKIQALACEKYGDYLSKNGKSTEAEAQWNKSCLLWELWGGEVKSRELQQKTASNNIGRRRSSLHYDKPNMAAVESTDSTLFIESTRG
mmetsp:Transcript_22648/g.49486  ORF Transcript_22648/g.49486 Transcript_22648/m.49486 type:complete len:1128 (+) Transcript_22648:194-3577(+)